MNTEKLADCRRNEIETRRVRRFNRSQDKDSVSPHPRQLSDCSSDSNLFKFYKPTPHVIKPIRFLD